MSQLHLDTVPAWVRVRFRDNVRVWVRVGVQVRVSVRFRVRFRVEAGKALVQQVLAIIIPGNSHSEP